MGLVLVEELADKLLLLLGVRRKPVLDYWPSTTVQEDKTPCNTHHSVGQGLPENQSGMKTLALVARISAPWTVWSM